MRLAAQQKGGFYPAHPQAILEVLKHLEPPKRGTHCAILDPCAGEGEAIKQLGEALGVQEKEIHAVELDDKRAATLRENLPDAKLLAPASFTGVQCSNGQFSFAWVNPPYDDELGGGGRVEMDFMHRVTPLLRRGGVLCLALPEPQVRRWANNGLHRYMLSRFEQVRVMPFPAEVRKYREVVVFGILGTLRLDMPNDEQYSELAQIGPDDVYTLPAAAGPKMWEKSEPTYDEMAAMFGGSKLLDLQKPPPALKLARPPLPLAKGHRAMMLAAGHLDGIVRPAGELPHVVRGTARKAWYHVSTEETVNEATGGVSIKQVMSERIVLTVRAVDGSGKIHTFANEEVSSGETQG